MIECGRLFILAVLYLIIIISFTLLIPVTFVLFMLRGVMRGWLEASYFQRQGYKNTTSNFLSVWKLWRSTK